MTKDNTALRHRVVDLEQTVLEQKAELNSWRAWTLTVYDVWGGAEQRIDKFRSAYNEWMATLHSYKHSVAVLLGWASRFIPMQKLPSTFLGLRAIDFPFHDGTRMCHSWDDIVVHNVVFSDVALWQSMPGMAGPPDHSLVPVRSALGVDDSDVGNLHGVWYELRERSTMRDRKSVV